MCRCRLSVRLSQWALRTVKPKTPSCRLSGGKVLGLLRVHRFCYLYSLLLNFLSAPFLLSVRSLTCFFPQVFPPKNPLPARKITCLGDPVVRRPPRQRKIRGSLPALLGRVIPRGFKNQNRLTSCSFLLSSASDDEDLNYAQVIFLTKLCVIFHKPRKCSFYL